jgi:hypothetical protein
MVLGSRRAEALSQPTVPAPEIKIGRGLLFIQTDICFNYDEKDIECKKLDFFQPGRENPL